MAIQKQMIGVKGDECQCGRRATIRHCPSCGSTRVYARSNRVHTYVDGSMKHVDVEFRCQGCGHLFVDEERQFCDAPPVGTILAAQKVKALQEANKTGEHLRPRDKKLADALAAMSEETVSYDTNSLKTIWFKLRNAWIDLKIQNGGKSELSLLDFLSKHLTEANVPQHHIDQILDWQREVTSPLETSNG